MEDYQNKRNGVRSAKKREEETEEQREKRLACVRNSFNQAYKKKEQEGRLTEENIKIAKLYEELDKMYAKSKNMENYEKYAKWCEENGSLPRTGIEGVKAAKKGEKETKEQRELRLGVARNSFNQAYKKKEREGTLTEEDIKIAKLYEELDKMYAKSTIMENYEEYAKWCEENGSLPRTSISGVKAAKKGEEETKEQRELRLGKTRTTFNTAYKKKEKEGTLTEEDIKIAQLYKALDEQYKSKKSARDLAQAVKDVPITEAEQANEYLETIVNQKEKEGASHTDE